MPLAHHTIVLLSALNKEKRSMGALLEAAKESKVNEVTRARERAKQESEAALDETESLK